MAAVQSSSSHIQDNTGAGIYVSAYQLTGAVTIDSCQIKDNGSVGISTGGGDAGGK